MPSAENARWKQGQGIGDKMTIILDGSGAALGRLSSTAAKKLLKGEQIKILHAEKVIITGDPTSIVKEYMAFKGIGSPQHGPFYPRRPDMLVRRTVRGMLPKTKKGREALKNLRVYIENPENEKGEALKARQIKSSYITVGDVAKQLGWIKR
jgi:large subunit ribosomal protein L13